MMVTDKAAGKVLVVDDDAMERDMLSQILEEVVEEVCVASGGEKGLEMALSERPDLVLTDLLMPGMDGFALVKALRRDERTAPCAIVVISAVAELGNRVKSLELGADDVLAKPAEAAELRARVLNLLKVKAYNDYLRGNKQMLEQEVQRKAVQLQHAYDQIRDATLETVFRLTRAAEFRDEDTAGHTQRISHMSAVIGRALGQGKEEVEMLLYASAMHDVGKIGIPDSILLKPGKLDPQEWEVMKRHTTMGAEILAPSDTELLKLATTVAMTHHEKWDGSGYPNGLRGAGIPLVGRITAIVDVFDALSSKRPYKQPFGLGESVDIIRSASGYHFDPDVVAAFLGNLDEIVEIKRTFNRDR